MHDLRYQKHVQHENLQQQQKPLAPSTRQKAVVVAGNQFTGVLIVIRLGMIIYKDY